MNVIIEHEGWIHSVNPETRCAAISMGPEEAKKIFGDDLRLLIERDKGKFSGELHCMPFGTIQIPA